MNLCGNCGYKMGSVANFCGMCGVILPVAKNPPSEEERSDTEQWREPDENGVCSNFFHSLIRACEGWCSLCKIFCKRTDHSRHQKSSFEYCPECGIKFKQ